jgi:antitoxin HigA-1
LRGETMERLPNIHPGEILKEEFLEPFGVSAYRLSREIKIPQRRITADTALRLAEFFGNSPQFWMGIQDDYDLEEERLKIEEELKQIPRVKAS